MRYRPTALVVLAVAAVSLTGCTHSTPTPTPSDSTSVPVSPPTASSSPSPSPTAIATPSPTPTPQAPRVSIPPQWKAASAAVIDQLASDPKVTDVVGAWIDPSGAEASIVEQSGGGVTDPEAYFAATFGKLGAADGVSVSHTVSTTDAGVPLLVVDIEPAGGVGGNAETSFFVLTGTDTISGVMTYAGARDDAARSRLLAVALSVTVG